MNFHQDKCKVLSVTYCSNIILDEKFVYCLDGVPLKYVNSEKDLGVYITTNLNWKEHVYYLCSKANRMLGLVRRTCHFIKNPLQKKSILSCYSK